MPSKNPMIRVPPDIYDRLVAHSARLLTAVIAGQSSAPVDQDVVPLWRVIELLLDHYERWQVRKAVSRRKRRAQGRPTKASVERSDPVRPGTVGVYTCRARTKGR